MKPLDIIRTALRNAFRSRLRTTLTALAIAIGAFTLTLTNAIGAGVNAYIADTVAAVGVDDVMTVTRTSEQGFDSGPAQYVPDSEQVTGTGPGAAMASVQALTADDLDTIAAVDGVQRVEANRTVAVDYVQYDDGTPYQLSLSQFVPGMQVELAAGEQVALDADEAELVLPDSYLDPLGLGGADDAVGRTLTLAVTDVAGTQHTVTATVVGVAEPGLVSATGAVPNETLVNELADLARTGAGPQQPEVYASASVWFDVDAGTEATEALQDRLAAEDFTAVTLDDQLGAVTSVIDTVVLVLNGFAVIALIAASIGIINTLFMAVQERTREVGLMKAMGLSDGRVFALFSIEAIVIGLLGSLLGVLVAVGVGQVVQAALAGTILSQLPGLTLVLFEPVTVAVVVLVVLAIAFLAGTLPALRAARQDPISALRYE